MYKYGEQNYTEYYKKPVIKVHPGNLKISKAITGLEDNQEALQKVLQNLSFTCALTKPDGKTETKELKLNTDGLVWNAENNAYEYTFTNLTPGTTYKVNENDAILDGYDLTVSPDTTEISGQIAGSTTSEAKFVNRYIRSDRVLTIAKRVGGNMGDRTHAFRFQVQTKLNGESYTGGISYVKYDAQGNPVSEEELKNAVAVENGVYTFQLRHMEKIEMTMPYGVEYIVSEEPEDYDVQITKKVSEEEEQKLDNGKKELSDMLSENTDLTFTNMKEVQPATGIRQTSAPYMVMTGAAFGMLAFFGLVYGIRKWGDPTGE